MRNSTLVVIILVIVVAIGFFFLGSHFTNPSSVVVLPPAGTPTTTPTGPAPGNDWQVYGNAMFTIRYPDVFQNMPTDSGSDWRIGANDDAGTLDFALTLPKSFEPNTNFGDAKLTVGESANKTSVSDCMKPDSSSGPSGSMTTKVINGVSFTVFTSSDAGAGNLYDTTSYRAVRGDTCYAVEYTIHYSQFGNYPPGTVSEFDEAKVKAELDSVVDTFTFK